MINRELIIKWIRTNATRQGWVAACYCHLISQGVAGEEALVAITQIVDELIEAKQRQVK
jgi:hypothetical protein